MVQASKLKKVVRLGLAITGLGFASAVLASSLADPAGGGPASNAAATPPAKADAAADKIAKGRTLFDDAGCSACHTLADAGASGAVGPSLDHDPNLSEAFIVNRVTNGQAGMPPFAGQLSDEDIADVAAYIMKAAAK